MESWIESFIAGWGWELLVCAVSLFVGYVISFFSHRPQIKALRKEVSELKTKISNNQEKQDLSDGEDAIAKTVDYIGACGIIDFYIEPATIDLKDRVRLMVRKDIIDRFDKVTGAKLGPSQYNLDLLQSWMQSNAARFIVKYRTEML